MTFSLLNVTVIDDCLLSVKLCYYFQMLSAVLIQLERGKGFITSGVLFVFFLLMTLAGIVPFYTYIEEKVYPN